MSDYTSLLFARPSFVEGVARILDLAGAMNEYNTMESPEEADWTALASDWYAVGEDIQVALEEFQSDHDDELDHAS